MLGLGLAVSHAPSMLRGLEHWPLIHRVLTDGVPQPPEIEKEPPEVLQSYIDRIHLGFEALAYWRSRDQLRFTKWSTYNIRAF